MLVKLPVQRLLAPAVNHFINSVFISKKDNVAAVLHKVHDIKFEQIPVSDPGPHQVLLQMEVVGICGSDIHFWNEGRLGTVELQGPMVLGHEASATVLECGKEVKNLKPGDRIALEPQIACGRCPPCKTGRYHICDNIEFNSFPPIHGILKRYHVTNADYCFKLPCHVSLEEGTLLEPLAVAVHGVKLGGVTIGTTCLVMGAGPVGLATLAACNAYGASKCVVLDLEDYKLEIANKMGAYATLNVKGMDEAKVISKVKDIFGDEPETTFDCVGSNPCIRIGLQVTKMGGKLVMIGMGPVEMNIPFGITVMKEITAVGSFRYGYDYKEALEIVSSGRADMTPLVTHRFRFEDTVKAYKTHKAKTGNPIKIMIYCNKAWDGCPY